MRNKSLRALAWLLTAVTVVSAVPAIGINAAELGYETDLIEAEGLLIEEAETEATEDEEKEFLIEVNEEEDGQGSVVAEEGYYRVPVSMLQAAGDSASMAGAALKNSAYIRTKDGEAKIYLTWQTIEMMGYYGNILDFDYYTEVQSGTWNDAVLAESTVESTHTARTGLITNYAEGTSDVEAPEVISFVLPWTNSGMYYIKVNVDVMSTLGLGKQSSRIKVDYDSTVVLTALDEAVSTAEDLSAADYTAESYEIVQNALVSAKEVFTDSEASQSAVDSAADALESAIEGLAAAVSELEVGKKYLIPVAAWKQAADEASMMASLIYQDAYVEMEEDGMYATFYMVPTTIMGIPIYPTAVGGIQYQDADGNYTDALFEVYDELTQVKAVKIELQKIDDAIPVKFSQSDYGSDIRLKFSADKTEETSSAPVFDEVEIFEGEYGDISWVQSFGGTKLDYVKQSTQLINGDFAVVGYTASVDGDFEDLNKGSTDAYVAVYSNNGALKSMQTLGSSAFDDAYYVLPLAAGGFMVAGSYAAADGDFASLADDYAGGYDGYLAKFDSEAALQNIYGYGGSASETFYSVVEATDGGYIVTGTTSSSDGIFADSGYSGYYSDVFVMKLNSSFEKQWVQCLGGSLLEQTGYSTVELADGSIMLGGHTYSKDGTYQGLEHYGNYSIFLAKLSGTDGTIQDINKYSSGKNAYLQSMSMLSDGSLLMVGSVTGNAYSFEDIQEVGKEDGILMKVKTSGEVEWIKTITGGYGTDGAKEAKTIDAVFAHETETGFAVAGYAQAERGVFAGQNRGGADVFLAEFDTEGELLELENIGGSDVDYLRSFTAANDGGYFLTVQTKSTDIDFAGLVNKGSYDIVALKIKEVVEITDKTALEAKITEAKAISRGNYTQTSYNALQTAIEAAQAVYDNDSAAPDEVSAQLNMLEAAVGNLTEKGSQTITAVSSYSKTYGNSAFSLNTKVTKGDGKLTYSSANTAVATVSAAGKVTIKGVGTAKITVKAAATGDYKETVKTVTVKVTKGTQKITAKSYTKVYGNKAFSLGAKRTAGNGKLTYGSSNKKVATVSSAGKITIKGTGKATITITAAATATYNKLTKKVTVTVKPKKAVLKTVKSTAKKKAAVTWKKDSRAAGYQIQYSTSSSFKKGNKTVSVSKNATVKKTLTKLTSGKKYYVRVRSYKTISGKKVYGSWSAKKSVRIK